MPGQLEDRHGQIDTPPLPNPLTGTLYVGQQKSSDPESGEEFRILAEAKDANDGVVVRLIGNTAANAKTGQLTTTFDEQEIVGRWLAKFPMACLKRRSNRSRSTSTARKRC